MNKMDNWINNFKIEIPRGGSVVVVVVGVVIWIAFWVPVNTNPELHLMVAIWPELFKDWLYVIDDCTGLFGKFLVQ